MTNILKLANHPDYCPKFANAVAQAQQEGIPVVTEESVERTVGKIIDRFWTDFSREIGTPPEVA